MLAPFAPRPMSRPLRFVLLVAAALVVVSFLPLFPEQMAMRSYTMGGSESVQQVWVGGSLYDVWSTSSLWRLAYVGLAGLYALGLAAGGLRVWDHVEAR